MHFCHSAKLSKEGPEFVFVGIKGEIPHIHFHRFTEGSHGIPNRSQTVPIVGFQITTEVELTW